MNETIDSIEQNKSNRLMIFLILTFWSWIESKDQKNCKTLEKILNSPGLYHLAENIFGNLNVEDVWKKITSYSNLYRIFDIYYKLLINNCCNISVLSFTKDNNKYKN